MRVDIVLLIVSLLMLVSVDRVMTAEVKVLRSDTVFRSLYLETFGHSNATEYPEILRKYQDFSRLTLAQVLRLPRCGGRDQKYKPLARVPTDTDSLLYLISQYPGTDPHTGPFSKEDVNALTREAAEAWRYSGVRLRQTRTETKADIVIRFCQFSECYGGDENITQLMDLTGVTRDRRGGGWNILINTELALSDERAPFIFPRLPNTHQQIQLTQVLIHQFGHVLGLPHLTSPVSAMSPFYLTGKPPNLLLPTQADFDILADILYRKRRTPRQYLIPQGDYLPSTYLPVWLYN